MLCAMSTVIVAHETDICATSPHPTESHKVTSKEMAIMSVIPREEIRTKQKNVHRVGGTEDHRISVERY